MAAHVVFPFLIPLEEDLFNATRLLSESGAPLVEFSQPRYCAVLSEDAPLSATILTVSATHSRGGAVRYSITGGNRDGLFTIDQHTGVITLAAALDHETHTSHELVVAGEGGGAEATTLVQVKVADVNDNPPYFLDPQPEVTVVEEDHRHLPATITTVVAEDLDYLDHHGLLYTVRGDGVDGYDPANAFFTINSLTGELTQLRPLDRDPPRGKAVWRVRVQVRDGQALWSRQAITRHLANSSSRGGHRNTAPSTKISRKSKRNTAPGTKIIHKSHQNTAPGTKITHKSKRNVSKAKREMEIPEIVRKVQSESKIYTSKQNASKAKRETKNPESVSELKSESIKYKSKRNTKTDKQTMEIPENIRELKNESKEIFDQETRYPKSESSFDITPNYFAERMDHANYALPMATEVNERIDKGESVTSKKEEIYAKTQINNNVTSDSIKTSRKYVNADSKGVIEVGRTKRNKDRLKRLGLRNTHKNRGNMSKSMRQGSLYTPLSKEHALHMSQGAYHDEVLNETPAAPVSELCLGGLTCRTFKNIVSKPHTAIKKLKSKSMITKDNLIALPRPIDQNDSVRTNNMQVQHTSSSYNSHNRGKRTVSKRLPSSQSVYEGIRNTRELKRVDSKSKVSHVPRKYQKSGEWMKNGEFESRDVNRVSNNPIHERIGSTREVRHNSETANVYLRTEHQRVGMWLDDEELTSRAEHAIENHLPVNQYIHGRSRNTRELSLLGSETLDSQLYSNHQSSGEWLEDEETSDENDDILDECAEDDSGPAGRRLGGGSLSGLGGSSGLHGLGGSRVHVAETEVTIRVKDVNDNPPVFPNATMFGLVQENGPIDLSVVTVAAWDADDSSEGSNARLRYAIQKNAMHERTGEAIFAIQSQTGVVRTAICCLDRETTTQYQVQVVATDGGGLQGTGMVVVRLADVNDNSPRLEQQLWEVEVDETWGQGPPNNASLLQISVLDPDTSNYFYYRVVQSSGWGWQHFGVRSVGAVGHIYARQVLDYEDETHRRGFRFMVQVTDRGRGGWEDGRHMDAAWVVVRLKDVNDNPPRFHRQHALITVRENVAPGTLLAALPALDPDGGGNQQVEYRIEGGWSALSVDSVGGVSLRGRLDREAPEGSVSVARILGVDHGDPPLTSTATLTITLTDVNDTPPLLLPPTIFHVTEGTDPTRLGILTATDQDVWALGHGPPFKLSLAPTNPAHVLAHIALRFDPHLDSGRGGAELRTLGAVDREQHPQLPVAVLVADAGGLTAINTITVIIDDINDNPMKPGKKTVYLWKPQGGAAEAPLGRVFVDDPDDWDLKDKTFTWVGTPHPLFTLNTRTGHLLASSQVREGRYDLQLSVSDQLWGQKDVGANVTVVVRVLPPDALAHAAPLTLTPTTPEDLTRGWTPQEGGGRLGGILSGIQRVVGGGVGVGVEVMSVEGRPGGQHGSAAGVTVAAVWVSVREEEQRYMDPIKLRGLLALHAKQLESATNLTVLPEEANTAAGGVMSGGGDSHHHQPGSSLIDPPSAASQASTSLPLQVVDTNSTSLVTPRLTRTVDCRTHEPQTCTATSCLNGGRCLAGNRCMCPGESWGPRCKILSRTFIGKDWAWVRPLPPCLPLTLSLRVLTRRPHALLFYSGPMTQLPRHLNDPPTPMLALQVTHGRPQVLVEGGAGPVRLEVPKDVSDGLWHTLHLKFSTKGVALVVDVSEPVQRNISITEGHSVARASWTSPGELSPWPLQIGGLAHARPHSGDHGWRDEPTSWSLEGCISHLRLNGQLVDLGEPAYSHGGQKGCQIQQAACPESCGHRGQCVGGLDDPECECEAGWQGPGCSTPTLPVTLASSSSYIKLALTFSPTPQMVLMQLRLRTRSTGSGVLLTLTDAQSKAVLTLHLRSGLACVSGGGGSGGERAERTVCVESRPLGDGAWHTLKAELHPYTDNLVVAVDDGDGWHRNQSLLSLADPGNAKYKEESMQDDQPVPLKTDEKYRVIIGALPASDEATISKTCVDDVRVSGRSVPLPPASNSSRWGEVNSWQGVGPGCEAPNACRNTTCVAPLTCINTWGRATCSCGTGRQLMGQACRDVDECLWQPCLHGGTCLNLRPGYQCVCGPGHVGDHCQWPDLASAAHPLTAPLAITALVLSIIMLVVVGVLVSVRLRRQGEARAQRNNQGVTKLKATESENIEGDGDHRALIEGLKVKLPQGQSPAIGKGPCLEHPSRSASHSPATEVGTTRTLPKNIGAKTGPGTRARLKSGHDLLPAQDDLRAYAYEGDGSSSGSLSSALSGLREEPPEDPCIKALAPEFSEVMDLLKNLPDAAKSSSALAVLVPDQPGSKQQPHPPVTTAGAELTTPPQNTRIYTISETDVNKRVSKPPTDRVSSLPYHDEETTAC